MGVISLHYVDRELQDTKPRSYTVGVSDAQRYQSSLEEMDFQTHLCRLLHFRFQLSEAFCLKVSNEDSRIAKERGVEDCFSERH